MARFGDPYLKMGISVVFTGSNLHASFFIFFQKKNQKQDPIQPRMGEKKPRMGENSRELEVVKKS